MCAVERRPSQLEASPRHLIVLIDLVLDTLAIGTQRPNAVTHQFEISDPGLDLQVRTRAYRFDGASGHGGKLSGEDESGDFMTKKAGGGLPHRRLFDSTAFPDSCDLLSALTQANSPRCCNKRAILLHLV